MRERPGLTQLELAQRLGLGEDQIGALEPSKISAGSHLRPILSRYFDSESHSLLRLSRSRRQADISYEGTVRYDRQLSRTTATLIAL
jgi:transcriptional regulator with XRE-family HTH domain